METPMCYGVSWQAGDTILGIYLSCWLWVNTKAREKTLSGHIFASCTIIVAAIISFYRYRKVRKSVGWSYSADYLEPAGSYNWPSASWQVPKPAIKSYYFLILVLILDGKFNQDSLTQNWSSQTSAVKSTDRDFFYAERLWELFSIYGPF